MPEEINLGRLVAEIILDSQTQGVDEIIEAIKNIEKETKKIKPVIDIGKCAIGEKLQINSFAALGQIAFVKLSALCYAMPRQVVLVVPWYLLNPTARCHDNKSPPFERCVENISHAFPRLPPCDLIKSESKNISSGIISTSIATGDSSSQTKCLG